MPRARESKITLPCSHEQQDELKDRARRRGLNVANYLWSLLGWPLEQQGQRKDLSPKEPVVERTPDP